MNDGDVPVRHLGTEVFFDGGNAVIEGYVVDQYKLNDRGTTTSCDGHRTVSESIAHVPSAYTIEPADCADDLRRMLTELHAAYLIAPSRRAGGNAGTRRTTHPTG